MSECLIRNPRPPPPAQEGQRHLCASSLSFWWPREATRTRSPSLPKLKTELCLSSRISHLIGLQTNQLERSSARADRKNCICAAGMPRTSSSLRRSSTWRRLDLHKNMPLLLPRLPRCLPQRPPTLLWTEKHGQIREAFYIAQVDKDG